MPDKRYEPMKKALLRVKKFCEERDSCTGRTDCPFIGKLYCRIADPSDWDIDDWREDEEDENA